MERYIYNNWQADGNHFTIHKWNCGHCHDGRGKHSDVDYGVNGVWIGPLLTGDWQMRIYVE